MPAQTTSGSTRQAHSHGVLRTVAGAVVGSTAAAIVTASAVAGPASDSPNGWWHDPDGWLVWLIPPAFVTGAFLGAWLALRVGDRARRGRTLAWMAPMMILGLSVSWAMDSLTAGGVLVPQIAGVAGARLLATRAFD